MARFDSHKHKMPDGKDLNALKTHLKTKYEEKK
jgi:hypothetical protein